MKVAPVSFPVAMMKYLNKINGGRGVISSSQFLVTTHHCRDVTEAGA